MIRVYGRYQHLQETQDIQPCVCSTTQRPVSSTMLPRTWCCIAFVQCSSATTQRNSPRNTRLELAYEMPCVKQGVVIRKPKEARRGSKQCVCTHVCVCRGPCTVWCRWCTRHAATVPPRRRGRTSSSSSSSSGRRLRPARWSHGWSRPQCAAQAQRGGGHACGGLRACGWPGRLQTRCVYREKDWCVWGGGGEVGTW
jgi:hypothetical protein